MASEPMETDDSTTYDNSMMGKDSSSRQITENTYSNHDIGYGSLVEVHVNPKLKLYGVVKWIGEDERMGPAEKLAGIELEDEFREYAQSDGSYLGKRYFQTKGHRAFFIKLRQCSLDSRFEASRRRSSQTQLFENSTTTHNRNSIVERHSNNLPSIEGCILPVSSIRAYLGRGRGIQGYHNSCYMDATLFAMFSYSYLFDVALHRKKRSTDIPDYTMVQDVLRRKIVNPLRKEGRVKYEGVLELRKYLDKMSNVSGFTSEEKDPEEFVVLLFDKVLKVDSFIKLAMIGSDCRQESHLHQIFAEKDERHELPSVQYLVEYSFLTSDLQLAEVPSVFILQMPRFGKQKLYEKIKISSQLDISRLMLYNNSYDCFICGRPADGYCKQCSCIIDECTVYNYLCVRCYPLFHEHPSRKIHSKSDFKKFNRNSSITLNDRIVEKSIHQPLLLDLFAVVCIEKSHYVSFVKSGFNDDAPWLFFDSMADRVGGEDGQNIPEVSVVNEVNDLLNAKSVAIHNLDKKKDEKVLRLFQDASLCFYRCKGLSIYR